MTVTVDGLDNTSGTGSEESRMIATYDANNNPDIMMAAWGGQCEVDEIHASNNNFYSRLASLEKLSYICHKLKMKRYERRQQI